METTTIPPPTLEDFPRADSALSWFTYGGALMVGVTAFIGLAASYQLGKVRFDAILLFFSSVYWYAIGRTSKMRLEKQLLELTTAPKIIRAQSWVNQSVAARVITKSRRAAYEMLTQYFIAHKMSISGDEQYVCGLRFGRRIEAHIYDAPPGTIVDLLWNGKSSQGQQPEDLVSRLAASI